MRARVHQAKPIKMKPGGRPPKFDEPRRPITLTLPERTIRQLAAIDGDRARAIVKAADFVILGKDQNRKPVEIVEVAPGKGIILVGPSRCLRQIPWLHLAEITPERYLLTVTPGTAVESLEVALHDLLEELPHEEEHERLILRQLLTHLRTVRRDQSLSKAEMLLISFETPQRPS